MSDKGTQESTPDKIGEQHELVIIWNDRNSGGRSDCRIYEGGAEDCVIPCCRSSYVDFGCDTLRRTPRMRSSSIPLWTTGLRSDAKAF